MANNYREYEFGRQHIRVTKSGTIYARWPGQDEAQCGTVDLFPYYDGLRDLGLLRNEVIDKVSAASHEYRRAHDNRDRRAELRSEMDRLAEEAQDIIESMAARGVSKVEIAKATGYSRPTIDAALKGTSRA